MKKIINKFMDILPFLIVLLSPFVAIVVAMFIAYLIATSDLSDWFKFFLLR